MKHWLELKADEVLLRKMNRKEYYETMSWLRRCRRALENEFTFVHKSCRIYKVSAQK